MATQAVAVELFSTSILSNHKVRNRHERFISILQVKKIPFVYHDLASDDDAKSRWRRKALDPQIPGLLVHNEWRGTFEEFEESVELGELDLFLRIDQERAKREAEEGLAPQLPVPSSSQSSNLASASSSDALKPPAVTPRKPSKHVVAEVPRLAQPRAPSQNTLAPALPTAKAGYDRVGKSDTDGFLRSLGISDLSLTEDELNEVLEAGRDTAEKRKGRTSNGPEGDISTNGEIADRGEGKYPNSLGLGTSSKQTSVPRTYIPSADAGVKPLRLAKMGNGDSSRSSSVSSPHARYNASQSSSRALAAEAQASASSRSFSTNKLREAISQGDDLKSAMSQTRLTSGTDTAEQVVGREDIDDLLASLGLDDAKMTDEEAEAFLFDGSIPDGMGSSGPRLGRSTSLADRARFETAAHDVAERARGKGYGSPKTPQMMENEGGVTLEDKVEPPVSIEKAIETTAATAAAESELDVKPIEVEDVKEEIKEEVQKEVTGEDLSTPKVASESFQDTSVEIKEEAIDEKVEDKDKDINEKDKNVDEKEGKGSYDEKQDGLRTGDSTPRQKTVDLFPAPPPLPDSSIIEKSESDISTNAEQEDSPDKTPPASPPVSPRKSSVQMSPTSSSLGRNSSITNRSPKPEPLELEQSFSALASQIHDDSRTPLTPSQSGNLESNTGSPPPPRKLSIGSPTRSAHSPSPRDHSLSPPSSAPAGSRTFNRRKGIDVPRRSVGASPSFDPNFSPSPSANGSNILQRGVGQTHMGASVGSLGSSLSATSMNRKASSNSINSSSGSPTQLKSPKSPKSSKKLFSIGRKSKDKRGSRKSGSSNGMEGEDSDEDIPTTTDPNLIESRSSMAAANNNAGAGSMDRSQKTLSVILREADEALSGLDGDDDYDGDNFDLDGMHGDDDDDIGGAFDLDIDDGIEVEKRR